jgi:ribosomal protein S18 acetylase RimI-like enzyme
MQNIQIVIPTINDAKGVVEMQKASWVDTYTSPQNGILKEDIENKFDKNFDNRISSWSETINKCQSPDHYDKMWIAKDGVKIIAFIVAHKKDSANSLGVYVLSEYQRNGLGQQLVNLALDWLGEEKEIRLECVAYNQKAINFYQKNGFKIDESVKTDGSTLPSGKIIPTVEMVKRF